MTQEKQAPRSEAALWRKAQTYLRCILTKPTYDRAIAPARLVGIEDGCVVIAVASATMANWLNGLGEMRAIARDVFGCSTLTFEAE